MSAKPVRSILTVLMDVLVAVAIALTVRLIVVFFGQIAAQSWAAPVTTFTNLVVIPFGVGDIKTPYGGYFDVNAALTIVTALVLEWVLSVVRSRG